MLFRSLPPLVPTVPNVTNEGGVAVMNPFPLPTVEDAHAAQRPASVLRPPSRAIRKPLRPNATEPAMMTRSMRQSLIVAPKVGCTRSQLKNAPENSNHSILAEEIEQMYDVAIISDPKEPKTVSEALRSEEREKWKN